MNSTHKLFLTHCALFFSLGVACPVQAGDSVWTAASGIHPENAHPRWDVTGQPNSPVLEAEAIRIHGTNDSHGFYQGDRIIQNPLDIPTNLVLEARVRVVSGTASIWFVTRTGVENWLSIRKDEIFVNAGSQRDRGATANVDTDDAFHTYRIEVQGVDAGSTFQVFYDGVPTLTGSLYIGDDSQPPEIFWGSYPSGETLWQSFRHNGHKTPTLSAFPATEVCWASKSNLVYQVRWASSLPGTNWTALGAPRPGTGAEDCIFDSTRTSARRFYRVEVVE